MGYPYISNSGRIFLWVGGTTSPETSQQIADVYSFSHILHGLIFYCALTALLSRRNFPLLLVLCTLIEASWEILENSPWIIERYRRTAALGYQGDSILNSTCDILFCLAGFLAARKLPLWSSIALFAMIEFAMLATVRDSLVLNIIMLIYPVDPIKHWQLGA